MSNTILFPPIVDTYQEAFVFKTEKDENDKETTTGFATLKFTNPNGNNASILEISVTDRNNRSVLLAERQAEGDEILSLIEYKITDKNVNFTAGNWYKVQGRYIKVDSNNNNKKTYSEWSTVSLIKAINQPEIQLTSPREDPNSNLITVISSSINVSGTVKIKDNTDTVKSYQITLKQDGDNKTIVVEKTGVLYPIATNQIGPYQLKHSLFNGQSYTLILEYETNGFYKGKEEVTFDCTLVQKELGGLFQVKPINEKGYVEIQLGLTASDITNEIYNIQRSSYKDNHSKRETLFTVDLSKFGETPEDYPNALNDSDCTYSQVFADTTAEPGIIYRYYLVDSSGNEYIWDEDEVSEEPFKKSTLPFRETMLDTEHIHLTDKNSSFVLNLNPSITNYKYVVQESITNTLGSAFPFVRRSGNTKYRQFNIGGTICGYGDQDGMLLTSNSVYSLLGQSFLDQYKLANRIMPWNDYIFEKQYRDKAIEFLMDGKPKIFKSFTEGNMIVALTAVSFTPNKQLANNIYDFTATVTEIADFTIENCKKYNCYEDKAEKIWSPAEYYLIANEMDGNTAGVSGSMIEDNYLTVYEISNALKPYVFTDELAEILANDSVNRGTNT